jgi:hypothetical protein
MLPPVRKVAGVLSMAGLLALTACGGGGHRATHTATAKAKGSAPTPASGATAKAAPLGPIAIAGATDEVASAVGDAVLAPAALVAATTPPTGTTAVATTKKAPAPVPTRVITSNATGEFAVAHTNGTFRRPTRIVLKVAASPSQNGSVFWTLVCSEDGGGVGHKQAQTTVQLPTSETLPIPAPSTYCIASANVQLSKSGTVTISITG